MLEKSRIEIKTKGEIDIVNITNKVKEFIERTDIKDGSVNVFNPGATGALTTIEYEERLLKDFKNTLREIIPDKNNYEHDKIDNNAHSHLRASILGPSITAPIEEGNIKLGTWQQIVFIELDVKPRSRSLIIHVRGE